MTPLVGRVVFHLGRIGLASLFILGGVNKLLDPGPSIADMTAIEVPLAHVAILAVIAIELGLGLVIAAGDWLKRGRFVAAAAGLLIIHTAMINALLHPFWMFEGAVAATQLSLFFKNVSIMGGLALVAGVHWPEKGAFDRKPNTD